MFSTVSERDSCTRSITADKDFFDRTRLTLSDELSASERQCCDMLFNALRYLRLQSCFVPHSKDGRAAKVADVSFAKARLPYYFVNGNLYCSHRRMSDV